MNDPLAQLTAAQFATAAQLPFVVSVPGGPPVALRLVDVTESYGAGSEQFSLIFTGPADRRFDQGIHPVRHDTLGTFALFLVPVGTDGVTAMYQAVFNRLTPAQ